MALYRLLRSVALAGLLLVAAQVSGANVVGEEAVCPDGPLGEIQLPVVGAEEKDGESESAEGFASDSQEEESGPSKWSRRRPAAQEILWGVCNNECHHPHVLQWNGQRGSNATVERAVNDCIACLNENADMIQCYEESQISAALFAELVRRGGRAYDALVPIVRDDSRLNAMIGPHFSGAHMRLVEPAQLAKLNSEAWMRMPTDAIGGLMPEHAPCIRVACLDEWDLEQIASIPASVASQFTRQQVNAMSFGLYSKVEDEFREPASTTDLGNVDYAEEEEEAGDGGEPFGENHFSLEGRPFSHSYDLAGLVDIETSSDDDSEARSQEGKCQGNERDLDMRMPTSSRPRHNVAFGNDGLESRGSCADDEGKREHLDDMFTQRHLNFEEAARERTVVYRTPSPCCIADRGQTARSYCEAEGAEMDSMCPPQDDDELEESRLGVPLTDVSYFDLIMLMDGDLSFITDDVLRILTVRQLAECGLASEDFWSRDRLSKIPVATLNAFEAEDWARLPAPAFLGITPKQAAQIDPVQVCRWSFAQFTAAQLSHSTIEEVLNEKRGHTNSAQGSSGRREPSSRSLPVDDAGEEVSKPRRAMGRPGIKSHAPSALPQRVNVDQADDTVVRYETIIQRDGSERTVRTEYYLHEGKFKPRQ